MKKTTAILIFSSLLFTLSVHAAGEDGTLKVYNGCKATWFHIIPKPTSSACTHFNIEIQEDQVFPIPVITQSAPGVPCEYEVSHKLGGVIQQFGPFLADNEKIVTCLHGEQKRGPCTCAYP